MKRFKQYLEEMQSNNKPSDNFDGDLFLQVSLYLDDISKSKNFHVSSTKPRGQPGKNAKHMREYRMQLVNKNNDTSKDYIDFLNSELRKNPHITNINFNKISPNSSKFSSYSFKIRNQDFDIVIAKGANKGENFEKQTVDDLSSYFGVSKENPKFGKLIELMNQSNKDFASVEIVKVKQRTGNTKKEGVPIEKLGSIIGDIVLTDSTGKDWFISLKDYNGDTFSSYSGASTILNNKGEVQGNSPGSKFLLSFGVDLNKVQQGFDERANKKTSSSFQVTKPNQREIKNIFERAWGMNYFYVRKTRSSDGWKVFWIDRKYLDDLSSNIVVDSIDYPSKKSKQISIKCHNSKQRYKVEIRNSKSGEYPNDIKFKVLP
jgi:hypothetical protein